MAEYVRSGSLLSATQSRLLIVDVQEKLIPLVLNSDAVTENCRLLCQAAEITSVPICMTEQYPKGLGATVAGIAEFAEDRPPKVRFSAAEVVGWTAEEPDSRTQIVVAGIETHVCIQQTCLDLLAQGFAVYVVADAVSSRGKADHKYALQRMRDSGATIITTEVAMFEWCEVAGTDEFKAISKLVVGRGR